MTSLEEIFGKPIHVATEQDLIDQGVLFEPYPERYPWLLLSSEVNAACHTKDSRTFDQCALPLMADAVYAWLLWIKENGEDKSVALHHTVAGTVWISKNSQGGLTIYQPHEQ